MCSRRHTKSFIQITSFNFQNTLRSGSCYPHELLGGFKYVLGPQVSNGNTQELSFLSRDGGRRAGYLPTPVGNEGGMMQSCIPTDSALPPLPLTPLCHPHPYMHTFLSQSLWFSASALFPYTGDIASPELSTNHSAPAACLLMWHDCKCNGDL